MRIRTCDASHDAHDVDPTFERHNLKKNEQRRLERVKRERRRRRRVGPHARNGEHQSGVTTAARHDAIFVLIDAVQRSRRVRVVALVRQAREDVETPYGVRDHIEHGQHGRVKDTCDTRNDQRLECGPHLLNQRDQLESPKSLQRPREPAETANEDQARHDVDDNPSHDEKVEYVPYTPDVRVRSKQKPIRDDLDDELHHKREPKHRLGNIEPRTPHGPMFRIEIPTIKGRSDRLDDDPPNDSDEQDELEDSVRDRRQPNSVNTLAPRRTNEHLAKPPQ